MNHMLQFLVSIVDAGIVLALLYCAKLLADRRTKFDDDLEVEERNNMAVAIRRAGLYLGMAIALTGALSGSNQGLWRDAVLLLIEGAFVLVAMAVARAVNDKYILPGINNDKECVAQNHAVGLVEFGHYVATGLIINGSLVGEGGGMVSVIVWFVVGQGALLLLAKIYQATASYGLMEEIRNKNTAAGINLAGMLIALGVILRFSLAGPFIGWLADFKSFGLSLAMGMGMLLALRWAIDLLFLPNTDLKTEICRDRNIAALVVAQGVLISLALIIGAAL